MHKPTQPKPPTKPNEQGGQIAEFRPETTVVSAFVEAIRFRQIGRAVAAYNNVLLEQANTELAFARLDQARLEADRAARLLADAETIHEADKLERDMKLLQAKQRMAQMGHEAQLAEMERRAELRHARAASDIAEGKAELSEEEQELVDALMARMKPDRFRALLERTIKEQKLSKDDEEKARQIMEELIRQSL